MARRSKKRRKGRKGRRKSRRGGRIPLKILEKRLTRLGKIVASRGGRAR